MISIPLMKFSIANWHERPCGYWLSHNAFTIMVSPPLWAKRRNLDLFVPTSKIVWGHKNGSVSDEEYTRVYTLLLQVRMQKIKNWIKENEYAILLCACPNGNFCHRYIVAERLKNMGCKEISLYK